MRRVRSNHGHRGVNRLLSRLVVEYRAHGWTIAALSRASGVHRSVLDRWLDGRVSNPLVNPLVAFVEAMGMRLDIVAPHHQPLLALDEFETQAMIAAARAHHSGEPMQELPYGGRNLKTALTKLKNVTMEATQDV